MIIEAIGVDGSQQLHSRGSLAFLSVFIGLLREQMSNYSKQNLIIEVGEISNKARASLLEQIFAGASTYWNKAKRDNGRGDSLSHLAAT